MTTWWTMGESHLQCRRSSIKTIQVSVASLTHLPNSHFPPLLTSYLLLPLTMIFGAITASLISLTFLAGNVQADCAARYSGYLSTSATLANGELLFSYFTPLDYWSSAHYSVPILEKYGYFTLNNDQEIAYSGTTTGAIKAEFQVSAYTRIWIP